MYGKILKMQIIKTISKYLILFIVGGLVYCGIELLWRGKTHWTMFIVGGICFLFCGSINELFEWDMPLWKQMLICTAGITTIEFISGIIINIICKLNVWDYSNLPLNVLGQISLLFSVFWFFLSAIAIILDDYLRYWWFGEEKPRYKLW